MIEQKSKDFVLLNTKLKELERISGGDRSLHPSSISAVLEKYHIGFA
jgi:hypothetical protein